MAKRTNGKKLPPGYLLYRKTKAVERQCDRRMLRGRWAGPILGFIYIET